MNRKLIKEISKMKSQMGLIKEDVNEVKNGTECGMGIKNYKDIKPGDKIEVYDRKEEAQSM